MSHYLMTHSSNISNRTSYLEFGPSLKELTNLYFSSFLYYIYRVVGREFRREMEDSLLVNGKGGEKREGLRWVSVCEEVKRLGCLAAPMVAVILSQYLVQVVSLMMVGHLGELALSSTAIAISLSGVSGFSLLVRLFFSI